MQKTCPVALAIMLVISLAACAPSAASPSEDPGGGAANGVDATTQAANADDASPGGEPTGNAADAVDAMIQEAIEGDAFSESAATQALASRGLQFSSIEPDWPYTIDESKMTTYGDTSHGTVEFIKSDGEITDEEFNTWLKKVFDATATASDDGHNIQGFSFGDGEVERTWDEIADSESFILTWSYKYTGTIMDVYPDREEDPEQESEVFTDDAGQWQFVYHYKSVTVDVSTGLQKSFDDTMADVEQYFDEHGDEIEDALKDAGIGG